MVKFIDKNSGFNAWSAQKNKTGTPEKKSMFSGLFWWLMLMLSAWWLYSIWSTPKPVDANNDLAKPVAEDVSGVPVLNIGNDKISAHVRGIRISNIELKDYFADKKISVADKVKLLSGDNEYLSVGFTAAGTTAPTDTTAFASTRNLGDNKMMWKSTEGVQFNRIVSADNYVISVRDSVINNSNRPVSVAPYARIVRVPAKNTSGVKTGGVAYVNSDLETRDWSKIEKKSYAYQTVNGFVGFSDQYWETVVSVNSPDQTMLFKKTGSRFFAETNAGAVNIVPGATVNFETKFFAGPKEQSILNAAAASVQGLDKTVDYGWFWFLSRPMSDALNFLNALVLNYGLAIILLTIALRILMWPLTRKSFTSMAAMQTMQPEMARVQKLYANDKARLQMEMMKLYQTHKTSPMSGCLPMLLQIPIFFALYKALLISVPMRGAGFLWISDLAKMDPLYILPVLMGLSMWWQQHLQSPSSGASTASNDPAAQTQKLMKWMPLIFTFMFMWMPAGLVLYWTVSNLFGIGQMYVIKKTAKK